MNIAENTVNLTLNNNQSIGILTNQDLVSFKGQDSHHQNDTLLNSSMVMV